MDYIDVGMSLGKYYLESSLGAGAFGKVFLAYNQILKRYVAIKVIEAQNAHDLNDKFKEAELSLRCNHNNIVKIYSADVIDFKGHLLFLIEMEYICGNTVEDLIENNKLSIIDSILIIKQILYGIEYAHLNGVIHRDIKPGNILVAEKTIKITDFGLANLLGENLTTDKFYYTHTAPEVFRGDVIFSIQTDVYALGITLYRMVNNIGNWSDFFESLELSESAIKSGKFIEKLPWDHSVPQCLRKIIKKACHENLDIRYSRAVELRNKLEKLRLGIKWYIKNDLEWCGEDLKNDYTMKIINKGKTYFVEIKCNGRKINKVCKSIDTIAEAYQYCKNYIAQTSIINH